MAETSQVEMDIFTLGLVPSAPVEQVNQAATAAPGFEETLEQVETGGLCPSPLGPPGPEPPPPDFLTAGEGVEGIEPNALPKELDFQPLPKVEVDIDLPKPFWEEANAPQSEIADAKVESDSKPVEQAMEWLAGQMLGGFFATPVVPTTEPVPVDAKATASQIDAITDAKKPVVVAETPDFKAAATIPTTPDSIVAEQPTTTSDILTSEIQDALGTVEEAQPGSKAENVEFKKEVAKATGEDATEVLTTLNATKVETTAKTSQPAFGEKREEADSKSVSERLPTEKDAKSIDPLLQRGKTAAKEVTTEGGAEAMKIASDSTPKSTDSKAEVASKAEASESTALQVDPNKSNADSDAKNESNESQGQAIRQSGSVEERSEKEGDFEIASIKNEGNPELTRMPDQAFELDATAPVRTVAAKEETNALQPGEVDSVVKQLSDRLHLLAAARPRNGVTVHLTPDELGSITVVVKAIGRQVQTELLASDDRVRNALDQNQSRLVDAMDARGFQLQTVTVSQQSGHSTQQESPKSWQQSNNQQNQSQNPSGQSQSHQGQSGRHFEQPKPQPRAWSRKQEGVDLSI